MMNNMTFPGQVYWDIETENYRIQKGLDPSANDPVVEVKVNPEKKKPKR